MSEGNQGSEEHTDTGQEGSQTGAADDTTVMAGEGGEGSQNGQEGGDGKGGEGSESAVPESYDFAMPEGMEIDQALAEAASPVFKELGLNQEQAGKLTEAYAGVMQQQAEAAEQAFSDQITAWNTELKNDAEFGGDKFEENGAKIREFLGATLPDDLKDEVLDFFQNTGAGSHPALTKYFFSLASRFNTSEDQPGSGNAGGGQRLEGQAGREQRLYG
jgi:hypothetical protein